MEEIEMVLDMAKESMSSLLHNKGLGKGSVYPNSFSCLSSFNDLSLAII